MHLVEEYGSSDCAVAVSVTFEYTDLECEGVNIVVYLHDVRHTAEHSTCQHRRREREYER